MKIIKSILQSILFITFSISFVYADGVVNPTLGKLIYSYQNGALGGGVVGYGITNDKNGNAYIAGYTNKAFAGQKQQGKMDYFLAKYNSNGQLLWLREVGGTNGYTQALGVTTGQLGNVYVTGDTSVGISGQPLNGQVDYFIAKYDSNGNLVWAKQVGKANKQSAGFALSSDASNNFYITGETNGGLFGQQQNGLLDYFIAKYNSNGTLIWYHQVGASGGNSYAKSIVSNPNGDTYITGTTTKSISGQHQTGMLDYFIAKYDNNGQLTWSRQMGASNGSSVGFSVSDDVNNNVYITGTTSKGLFGNAQTGVNDYFAAKYDATGNLIWGRQYGVKARSTVGSGIACNMYGNCFLSGQVVDTTNGNANYLIARYDANGNLIWNTQVGNGGATSANNVSLDSQGNAYLTGETDVPLNSQRQIGAYDYFIAKWQN